MGEAKRRGTLEQRKAQAIARQEEDAKRQEEARLQAIREKHERIRALPPEARKELLMRRPSPKRMALALAVAAGALALPPRKP